MSKLYFSFVTLIFSCILSNSAYAQPKKGEFIKASIGLGLCSPYDEESDVSSSGFYAQAEYVWSPRTWFGVRPYVGLIIASGESDEAAVKESVKSNAALLGVKARIAAPIPYVAPYIESGIGMSLGSFETYTQNTNLKKNGALLHIPFTLGFAIGKKHSTEIEFTYYYHNAVKQFSGAAAIGLSFPLG